MQNDSVTDCEEAVCEPGSAPPYISIVPVEEPIRFCCPGQTVATNLCRVWWLVGYKIESIRAVVASSGVVNVIGRIQCGDTDHANRDLQCEDSW